MAGVGGVNSRILKSKTKSKKSLEGYNSRLDTAGERTRKPETDSESSSTQHTSELRGQRTTNHRPDPF